MAELILTDEEKAAHSWLDVDDATLGKAVKEMGLILLPKMKKDAANRWDGREALYLSSYALLVGMSMDDMNAASWEFTLERSRTGDDGVDEPRGTLRVHATIDPISEGQP